MTQQDVYQLLKKSKKPITSKEINKKLKFNGAVNNLAKLYKYGEVKRRIVQGKRGFYKYEYWV